ncbi:MAG: class I SAM-dependent methyltransferase [Chloroflexi bacterium]|nr:class I SAM-dependent methyltransferase [Chloroflexota bacterium]
MASIPSPNGYDEAYYAARQSWHDRSIESTAAVASLRALPNGRVVDVGAGTGPLFPLLVAAGYTPIGVETNVVAARGAQVRGIGAMIRVAPSPELPFATESIGGIIAQHLIEHLPDPGAALHSWHRVLQRGGTAVVLTPNARHPDPELFNDPDHRHLFTGPELAELLRSVGFELVTATALFPFFGRHRAGRAAGRRLWWLGRVAPFRTTARTLLLAGRKS